MTALSVYSAGVVRLQGAGGGAGRKVGRLLIFPVTMLLRRINQPQSMSCAGVISRVAGGHSTSLS